ncbi:unnamed protein product [Closterium sp. NIES-65]|nr:unnamed protein product [Closterium sp. NIES-65]
MVSRYLRLVVGACLLITESLRGAGSGDSGAVCAQAGSVPMRGVKCSRPGSSLPAVDALVRSITFCPVKQIYSPLSHISTSLPSPLPALHLLIVSFPPSPPFVHASSPLPLRPLCTHLPPSLSAPCARIFPPPSPPLVHASSPLPLTSHDGFFPAVDSLIRAITFCHVSFPSSPPLLLPFPFFSTVTLFDALVRSITFCPVKQIYFPLSHLSTSLPSPLPAPPNGLLPSLSAPSALISPHPLSTVMTVDALIRSITFCPVKQIYFPLSLHLQNGSFPNRSPLDCPSSSSFKGRRDGQQEEGQRKGQKNGQGNGQKEGLENGQEEGQKEERKEEGACFGDVDQNGRYRDPHFVALKVHAVGLVIQ